MEGAADAKAFHMYGRTYCIVAAPNDAGAQAMVVAPPLQPHPDASANATGYGRVSRGSRDFARIAVHVTNRGDAIPYNGDRDDTVRPGGLHMSPNALGTPHPHAAPSRGSARGCCAWPNGEYTARDDVTRAQAGMLGAPASEGDRAARDGWSARHGETAVVRFCYWADAEFRPESAQFHHTCGGSVPSVPFTERGSRCPPYVSCGESALAPLRQARVPSRPPADLLATCDAGSAWDVTMSGRWRRGA